MRSPNEFFKSNSASFVATDKPWGQREFGVATSEGHRIMFVQEIDD